MTRIKGFSKKCIESFFILSFLCLVLGFSSKKNKSRYFPDNNKCSWQLKDLPAEVMQNHYCSYINNTAVEAFFFWLHIVKDSNIFSFLIAEMENAWNWMFYRCAYNNVGLLYFDNGLHVSLWAYMIALNCSCRMISYCSPAVLQPKMICHLLVDFSLRQTLIQSSFSQKIISYWPFYSGTRKEKQNSRISEWMMELFPKSSKTC